MYEHPRPTAPADPEGITEPVSVDPTAWHLLQRLIDTVKSVEAIAYNMRIVTHLTATSDHRHLNAYAEDLTAAGENHVPIDRELRNALEQAARAWGLPVASPLSRVVEAAPDGVRDALRRRLDELQAVTTELHEDGALANELLESALKVVGRRCREAEKASSDPTYRNPQHDGTSAPRRATLQRSSLAGTSALTARR